MKAAACISLLIACAPAWSQSASSSVRLDTTEGTFYDNWNSGDYIAYATCNRYNALSTSQCASNANHQAVSLTLFCAPYHYQPEHMSRASGRSELFGFDRGIVESDILPEWTPVKLELRPDPYAFITCSQTPDTQASAGFSGEFEAAGRSTTFVASSTGTTVAAKPLVLDTWVGAEIWIHYSVRCSGEARATLDHGSSAWVAGGLTIFATGQGVRFRGDRGGVYPRWHSPSQITPR